MAIAGATFISLSNIMPKLPKHYCPLVQYPKTACLLSNLTGSGACQGRHQGLLPPGVASSPSRSARATASASDRTLSFSIAAWRWALMVRSEVPSS